MPSILDFTDRVVLASQSIARKRLLEDLGLQVIVSPTDCDESHSPMAPGEVVQLLARRKLDAYRQSHMEYTLPVLCCDTLVWHNNHLIGKPSDRKIAKQQLQSFSGTPQLVYSGWALWYEESIFEGTDVATVHFKELSESIIESYLDTEEWRGAAGSYRIQEQGKFLIDHVEGDFATVIGLPLLQISEILNSNCAR